MMIVERMLCKETEVLEENMPRAALAATDPIHDLSGSRTQTSAVAY
jgi:hypothetical protein